MRCNLIISRTANLLHFILSLDQNQVNIGNNSNQGSQIYLTIIEKKVATEIKKIFGSSKILWSVYPALAHQDPHELKKGLETLIGKKKSLILLRALSVYENRFAKDWPETKKRLENLGKYFRRHSEILNHLIQVISRLCGVENPKSLCTPIYLFLSENNEPSGLFSWTPSENNIILEAPKRSGTTKKNLLFAILAHEFFHLILRENSKLMRYLKKMAANKNASITSDPMALEELIVSSFIPEGFLATTLLRIKMKKRPHLRKSEIPNLLQYRTICGTEMYEMAKQYIRNQQPIDSKYIHTLLQILPNKNGMGRRRAA